jgi:hypothetical protein
LVPLAEPVVPVVPALPEADAVIAMAPTLAPNSKLPDAEIYFADSRLIDIVVISHQTPNTPSWSFADCFERRQASEPE